MARKLKSPWADLRVSVSRRAFPAVERFVDSLRHLHVNGGACFATFGFPALPRFAESLGRGELSQVGFFDHFWQAEGVRKALPELASDDGFTCRTPFGWGNPFTLEGEFASALFGGGAYSRYSGTTENAKAEAVAPATELLGERFQRVQVYTNHTAWCDYFDGIVDWTWVVFNSRSRLIHVIAATDVD